MVLLLIATQSFARNVFTMSLSFCKILVILNQGTRITGLVIVEGWVLGDLENGYSYKKAFSSCQSSIQVFRTNSVFPLQTNIDNL